MQWVLSRPPVARTEVQKRSKTCALTPVLLLFAWFEDLRASRSLYRCPRSARLVHRAQSALLPENGARELQSPPDHQHQTVPPVERDPILLAQPAAVVVQRRAEVQQRAQHDRRRDAVPTVRRVIKAVELRSAIRTVLPAGHIATRRQLAPAAAVLPQPARRRVDRHHQLVVHLLIVPPRVVLEVVEGTGNATTRHADGRPVVVSSAKNARRRWHRRARAGAAWRARAPRR
jgi:hypothetical protein